MSPIQFAKTYFDLDLNETSYCTSLYFMGTFITSYLNVANCFLALYRLIYLTMTSVIGKKRYIIAVILSGLLIASIMSALFVSEKSSTRDKHYKTLLPKLMARFWCLFNATNVCNQQYSCCVIMSAKASKITHQNLWNNATGFGIQVLSFWSIQGNLQPLRWTLSKISGIVVMLINVKWFLLLILFQASQP